MKRDPLGKTVRMKSRSAPPLHLTGSPRSGIYQGPRPLTSLRVRSPNTPKRRDSSYARLMECVSPGIARGRKGRKSSKTCSAIFLPKDCTKEPPAFPLSPPPTDPLPHHSRTKRAIYKPFINSVPADLLAFYARKSSI